MLTVNVSCMFVDVFFFSFFFFHRACRENDFYRPEYRQPAFWGRGGKLPEEDRFCNSGVCKLCKRTQLDRSNQCHQFSFLTPQVCLHLNENSWKNKGFTEIFFFVFFFFPLSGMSIPHITIILGKKRGMSVTLDWHHFWVCSTWHGSSSQMTFLSYE